MKCPICGDWLIIYTDYDLEERLSCKDRQCSFDIYLSDKIEKALFDCLAELPQELLEESNDD